jgi:hypothetical protein
MKKAIETTIKSIQHEVVHSIFFASDGNSSFVLDPVSEDKVCVYCGSVIIPINTGDRWTLSCKCDKAFKEVEERKALDDELAKIHQRFESMKSEARLYGLDEYKKIYQKRTAERNQINSEIDRGVSKMEYKDIEWV